MSVSGINNVPLAEVAPCDEVKKNNGLSELTNICVNALRHETHAIKKRSAAAQIQNNSNAKIRKIVMVQKHIINHGNGSFTECTVNKHGIPDGSAVHKSQSGTRTEYNFKDNLKQGLATRYYPDGDVETFTYQNDIKEGPTTYRYHTGILGAGTYVNGLLEGLVIKKSLVDASKSEAIYKNGEPTGIEKVTYSNGDELILNGNSAIYRMKK